MSYTVYEIACLLNNKVYIGYTKKSAEERFQDHLNNARWNRKGALYDAIRAYGPEAFSIRAVWNGDTHAEACAEERRLITETGSIAPGGYNLTLGGDGVPLTQAQYDAAAAKKRGRCSPKMRAYHDGRKGSKLPSSTRAKIGCAHRGRKQSADWIAKRMEKTAMKMRGRPWTPARRAAHEARGLV